MSPAPVVFPQNLQLQSPLIRLPAEIKHMIYGFCFTSDSPIIDPLGLDCNTSLHKGKVAPGVALLQTCRRAYHESDRRPLFIRNTFRFTTVHRMQAFLRSIESRYRECISDLEIDVSKVHSDYPAIARDWLQYSSCSLRKDAVGLQCLRLNFESWPTIAMFRTELWNFLREMLSKFEGLGRVVVTGASKGSGMAKKAPWSPVHFVGGDNVGSNDLVPLMISVVKGPHNSKIIRWFRGHGVLRLEVVAPTCWRRSIDTHLPYPCKGNKHTCAGPMFLETAKGSCTLLEYEHRHMRMRRCES